MSNKVSVDRFTRTAQTIAGTFAPASLGRLKPFLASNEGKLDYKLSGSERAEVTGRRIKRVKCTIQGWFFLLDPSTLGPARYAVSIHSRLVVVNDESELPPLQEEPPDEDYVTLGAELDVEEMIEEEVLLDLPLWAIAAEAEETSATNKSAAVPESETSGVVPKKPSPFAKLAALKKSTEPLGDKEKDK
jgi:uncharacterized protein